MEKDFRRTFNKCPCCGSEKQFCKELGEELKERGLARPEWNMRLDSRQGAVADPNRAVLIPIGARIPAFYIVTDICMDCGTVYAVEIARLEGQTQAAPQQQRNRPPLDLGNIRAN